MNLSTCAVHCCYDYIAAHVRWLVHDMASCWISTALAANLTKHSTNIVTYHIIYIKLFDFNCVAVC